MARRAREKRAEAIYHIIIKSLPEIMLFRNDFDRERFIFFVKRVIEKYGCRLYGFCLMDNHAHIHLNPMGADISKIMQSINTSYAMHFNFTAGRSGKVFKDRFESRILNDNEYNLMVSAYIHNNPHVIPEYEGREEYFKFSSYGIYLCIGKDIHKLIDKSFIMGLFNTGDEKVFAKRYRDFVKGMRGKEGFEKISEELSSAAENEYISGRKVILRDKPAAKVISYISDRLMMDEREVKVGGKRKKTREFRAFCAYALNVLCAMTYREVCETIYNITISGCARLCNRGFELMKREGSVYEKIFDELMAQSA